MCLCVMQVAVGWAELMKCIIVCKCVLLQDAIGSWVGGANEM